MLEGGVRQARRGSARRPPIPRAPQRGYHRASGGDAIIHHDHRLARDIRGRAATAVGL